jgi:hypothetical protein
MLDTEAQESTLQQSLLSQEVSKLNPFEVYYVLHFISTVQVLVLLLLFELSRLQMFQPLVFY